MTRLTQTKDGSYSLYSTQYNELYHSQHGAKTESNYVYIKNGLLYHPNSKQLTILELGFGTGLNTLLTLNHQNQTTINYTSIEAYPLSKKNHQQYLKTLPKDDKANYKLIYQSPWNIDHPITNSFKLCKQKAFFQTMTLTKQYDLVYADAFSPRKQPECWSSDIYNNLFKHMNPNAILVTYCSQGSFKRLLTKIGFNVETLPGPPGKREMTRATKPNL